MFNLNQAIVHVIFKTNRFQSISNYMFYIYTNVISISLNSLSVLSALTNYINDPVFNFFLFTILRMMKKIKIG